MDEQLYDIPDAMQFLKVSKATIYNLMQQGVLQSRYVGSSVRFTKEDLANAITTRDVPSGRGAVTRGGQMPGPGLPMKFG